MEHQQYGRPSDGKRPSRPRVVAAAVLAGACAVAIGVAAPAIAEASAHSHATHAKSLASHGKAAHSTSRQTALAAQKLRHRGGPTASPSPSPSSTSTSDTTSPVVSSPSPSPTTTDATSTGTDTSTPSPTTTTTPSTGSSATPVGGTNGVYGLPLDKAPASETHEEEALALTTNDTDYALIKKVFSGTAAKWLTSGSGDVKAAVAWRVNNAASRNSIATLVAYNIPYLGCRDNGETATQYRQWIDQFTAGLGTHHAIVIVEPDALPHIDCIPTDRQAERLELLRYAVQTISAQGSWAYLDAGNAIWMKPETIAARLNTVGIQDAAGFSLNVSAFRTNAETVPYGQAVSKLVGGKHFIVDTSRNGVPPTDTTGCNPPNKGLGLQPTTDTGVPELDAYLWVKPPGQSDGSCNGGQYGGAWLQDYALMLARNAAF